MRMKRLMEIDNFPENTKTMMFGQEDGKYFILRISINAGDTRLWDSNQYPNLSYEEAMDKIGES